MFKLIALRLLASCDSRIQKCLKTGEMYYFCNDYVIDEKNHCVKKNTSIPVVDNFYLVKPQINISAVVGKNGEGKSTLVELMMRLLNNCTGSNGMAAKEDSLRKVSGVKAELFYMVSHELFKISEKEGEDTVKVWRLADLKDNTKSEWPLLEQEQINVKEDCDRFFFTLVSNYSHYAYNIYDFEHEWEVRGDEKDDNEKCWLHYIFHKNDGYMAPITIHPYRDKGNIDINKEKDLSKQRLLSLFINAESPDVNPYSLRRVNDKDADVVVLKEKEESNLQQTVIIDYFKKYRNYNGLKTVLAQIAKVREDTSRNEIEYERLIDTTVPYFFEEVMDEVLDRGEEFKQFIKAAIAWLREKYPQVLPKNGDIKQVLTLLNVINSDMNRRLPIRELNRKYGYLKWINTYQLGRLDTVYRILLLKGYDWRMLFNDYQSIDRLLKCQHYITYKTWSVLTTYPQYEQMIFPDDQKGKIRECAPALEECYRRMFEDVDSHITRKLRQVENYIKEGFEDGDLYERLGEGNTETGELKVKIDKLKEHYNGEIVDLDHLPPALYHWDIEFKEVDSGKGGIAFDSFSSGEKQMLNSLGAIIYHLQNLNSTAVVRYRNVNVVMEEIELYYHPECQRSYVYRMIDLIKGANLKNIENINIMFVTHSPFVLSDIPVSNVLCLTKEGDKNPFDQTFAANIHDLFNNTFVLPDTLGEFARSKIVDFIKLYDQQMDLWKENDGKRTSRSRDERIRMLLLSNIQSYIYLTEIVGDEYIRGEMKDMLKELLDYYDIKGFWNEEN